MPAKTAADRPVAGAWGDSEERQLLATNNDIARAITNRYGDDPDEEPSGRKSLEFQYWRMCSRKNCRKHTNRKTGQNNRLGWITIGPTMASDPLGHARYVNIKHMEPLAEYGKAPTGEASEMMTPFTRFAQIMREGGLHEFPATQIIAYGWDKIEVIQYYRPDVKGVERIPCRYGCVGRDFVGEEGYRHHIAGAHPKVLEAEASQAAMREALQIVAGQRAPQDSTNPAVIAAVVTAVLEAMNFPVPRGERRPPEELPGVDDLFNPTPPPPPDDSNVASSGDFTNVAQARKAAQAEREAAKKATPPVVLPIPTV